MNQKQRVNNHGMPIMDWWDSMQYRRHCTSAFDRAANFSDAKTESQDQGSEKHGKRP
jgi:hypothetical protein